MQHGPAVRRRKLGEELRALRDRTGLTSGEAARIAGWHQSKISRIETGRSGVKPEDIRLLLDVYGNVVSPEQRALLEALSASAAGPGPGSEAGRGRQWWHDYRGLLPQEYRDFISLEAGARSARTVELSVVPGLLQTPEYARAVTRAALGGLPEPKVDALVDVRLARQSVLRADPPLELSAVLDEAVLRRQIGGPGVMAAQLRHLAQVARLPQVRLQVLPFSVGGHLGLTGPFVIFSFPNIADLDVVVLDHLTSSLYLERKEDLEAYSAAFRTIQAHALRPRTRRISSAHSLTTRKEAPPCPQPPLLQRTSDQRAVAAEQPQHRNEQLRGNGRPRRRPAGRPRLQAGGRPGRALHRAGLVRLPRIRTGGRARVTP